MTSELISVLCGSGGRPTIPELHNCDQYCFLENRNNELSPCELYSAVAKSSLCTVLIYIHDDVTIHDLDWHSRVLSLFSRPEVAVVGLGGAPRLGHPDMYKKPYMIQGMARGGYMSNQSDWEVHGGHECGDRRVAVVDAFFIAVRTDLLRRAGGWPVDHLSHHALDLWVCCEAARQKKEVWVAGVSCTHHGGGTSTKKIYAEAKWLQGGSLEEDHRAPHRWLFDSCRDVLPIEVRP